MSNFRMVQVTYGARHLITINFAQIPQVVEE